MTIDLEELRNLFNLLVTHIEQNVGMELDVHEDYYWNIPSPDRYDVYSNPDMLTVGQLTEDLQQLQKISDGVSEPIGYGLVWLASIIRKIGEDNIGQRLVPRVIRRHLLDAILSYGRLFLLVAKMKNLSIHTSLPFLQSTRSP